MAKTLTLKFERNSSRQPVELRAVSDSEAADWSRKGPTANSRPLATTRSMSMPIRFSLQEPDIFQPAVMQEFQRLVDHCFISKSTQDRKGGGMPKGMQVMRVVRVQNSTLMRAYYARR